MIDFYTAAKPIGYKISIFLLERQLSQGGYIGAEFVLSDMPCSPWIAAHKWLELTLDDYPRMNAWHDRTRARAILA